MIAFGCADEVLGNLTIEIIYIAALNFGNVQFHLKTYMIVECVRSVNQSFGRDLDRLLRPHTL